MIPPLEFDLSQPAEAITKRAVQMYRRAMGLEFEREWVQALKKIILPIAHAAPKVAPTGWTRAPHAKRITLEFLDAADAEAFESYLANCKFGYLTTPENESS